MLPFAENVRYLRNKQGLSQEAMALQLEVTRNRIASYEDGRAQPSLETLVKYSQYFKLPIDALLKNDLTQAAEGTFVDIGNHRILFPVLIDEHNEDLIEVVPLHASAGYLSGYADPSYIATLPRMQLPFLNPGKYRTFPIRGDSMEPGIKDGAFVVGKYVEQPSELVSAKTYVVITRDEGITYKRIDYDSTGEGWLTLKSDNPRYQPYEVPLSQVLELWEYTCQIDTQEYRENENDLSNMMQVLQQELMQIKAKLVSIG